MDNVSPAHRCTSPPSGSCPLGWGTALASVAAQPVFQKTDLLFPLVFSGGRDYTIFRSIVLMLDLLLDMLVAKRDMLP